MKIWKNSKIKIKVHPLFIVLGIFSAFAHNIFFFILYSLSVILHELGHALVAYKCGYIMNNITLLPYGAVISGEEDQFTSKDEIIIALAGPITNFLLSTLCVAVWWMFPMMYSYTFDFCMASLVAGVFNLLPVFPLDGGRVVLGLLSNKMGRNQAARIVKIITTLFSFILFSLFIFSIFFGFNISIGIASVLLFISVITDSKNAKYERLSCLFNRRKQIIRGIEERLVVVSNKSTLRDLMTKVERGKLTHFVVVDENFKEIKKINEYELKKLIESNTYKTMIEDII